MGMTRAQRIAAAFSQARDYEEHAPVQRQAARLLAQRIATQVWPENPRILEIGCGTGFLTRELVTHFPQGRLLACDLSWAMASRCRETVGGVPFVVMDGEQPATQGGWDLIASSLAFQWFSQLDAVSRLFTLLAPGGRLFFVTLGNDTFREWCQAHREEGQQPGTPAFPDAPTLLTALPGTATVSAMHLTAHYPSARDFLKRLKAIGAASPREGHHPIQSGPFRRILARLDGDGNGVEMTYHLLFAACRRD